LKKPTFLNNAFQPSSALFIAAIALLVWAVVKNAPGGAGWNLFWEDAASPLVKSRYLAMTYAWPALLAFLGVVLFQLQFRLSMSGSGIRTVFSICVIGSLAMLTSLRTISFSPIATPAYVFGMALGYTAVGRLYAIQMRKLWNRIPVPYIVWRGNVASVREIDRAMRARTSPPRQSVCDMNRQPAA
jgi:hypothetical protein